MFGYRFAFWIVNGEAKCLSVDRNSVHEVGFVQQVAETVGNFYFQFVEFFEGEFFFKEFQGSLGFGDRSDDVLAVSDGDVFAAVVF